MKTQTRFKPTKASALATGVTFSKKKVRSQDTENKRARKNTEEGQTREILSSHNLLRQKFAAARRKIAISCPPIFFNQQCPRTDSS